MSNPNDPAYPTGRQELSYQYDPSKSTSVAQTYIVPQGGTTIRQRFVMAAMQGLCARSSGLGFSETIKSAIEIADAVLAEEAKTRNKT